jgi:hypothetical protein
MNQKGGGGGTAARPSSFLCSSPVGFSYFFISDQASSIMQAAVHDILLQQ